MEYLLLKSSENILAISFTEIKEITHLSLLHDMPYEGKGYLGMLNYRGKSVPVYDLSLLFFDIPTAIGTTTKLMVIEVENPIGVVFDDVVENVRADRLEEREEGIFRKIIFVGEKMFPRIDYGLIKEFIESEKGIRMPEACVSSLRTKELLSERASHLESKRTLDEKAGKRNYYLIFQVNNELYAVDASLVDEVVQNDRVSKVPTAPDYILGIFPLRGNLVTVFDLRYFQSGSKKDIDTKLTLLITKFQNQRAALAVDRVIDFVPLKESDRFSPHLLSTEATNFIVEQFEFDGMLVNILDLNKFLEKAYEKEGVA